MRARHGLDAAVSHGIHPLQALCPGRGAADRPFCSHPCGPIAGGARRPDPPFVDCERMIGGRRRGGGCGLGAACARHRLPSHLAAGGGAGSRPRHRDDHAFPRGANLESLPTDLRHCAFAGDGRRCRHVHPGAATPPALGHCRVRRASSSGGGRFRCLLGACNRQSGYRCSLPGAKFAPSQTRRGVARRVVCRPPAAEEEELPTTAVGIGLQSFPIRVALLGAGRGYDRSCHCQCHCGGGGGTTAEILQKELHLVLLQVVVKVGVAFGSVDCTCPKVWPPID